MSPKHFLITGGGGFIGSALADRLLSEGHRVRVLDNHSRPARLRPGKEDSSADLVVGDICDPATVRDAVDGVECVVHLAAINGTEFFYSKPDLVLEVGVRGFINLLDACRDRGVRDLVVASTSEVYQFPPTVPTDETAPLVIPDITNPRYSYAGSKIITELMAMWCGRDDFDRINIFRPHNVYGPNMGWEHVLPQFILRARTAIAATPDGPVPFPIQGDGSQTRAFTHIDDCIDGMMVLIEKAAHRSIYHLGNPEELEIGDVARRVLAYFGREADIQPSDPMPGATPRRCPDISALRALGFTPRVSFDQGLPSIADWYVEHAHLSPECGALETAR